MFASRIPLRTLATICRSLGEMLDSGLPVVKSLKILAKKTGDGTCRRHLADVTRLVEQGHEIGAACREQGRYFPELFCDLVAVSEESGALPEVLKALADHYENLLRLRRNFMAAIAWPVIQFVIANFIIAFAIFIIGEIGKSSPGGKPMDTLGLGLMGATGAITWLTFSFGTAAALIGGYFLLKRGFQQQRTLDGLLMAIPVVGNCMRSFAIARFSWAFYLTQNAAMPIVPSLVASLKATGNGAFQGMIGRITNLVKEGEELSSALEQSGLFPEDYLQMVQVAESTGTVPEKLHQLSPQFEEKARRSLAVLAGLLGWVVWMLVAGMIIFVVFSVVMTYVNMINDLAKPF